MAKKTNKRTATVDLETIGKRIDELINAQDPLHKWLPVLNQLKPKLEEAIAKGVSLTKLKKTLDQGGLNIPQDLLKIFLDQNSHQTTKK